MRKGSPLTLCVFVSALAVLAATAHSAPEQRIRRPAITHGVASGDVRATTAIVWARADGTSTMQVQVSPSRRFSSKLRRRTARATKGSDYTARLKLGGLRPDTRHYYRVWFTRKIRGRTLASRKVVGSFRTAPAAGAATTMKLVFSGDLGGQKYCRDRRQGGYGILGEIAKLAPDFFLATGDMIYGDDECPPEGPDGAGPWQNIPGTFDSVGSGHVDWRKPAQVRDVYLRHWRYNRADAHFQRLLRSTPLYSQWDDHEVINDFGAAWPLYPPDPTRAGYPNLVRAGRAALFLYGVIDGPRVYRSFRWGKDVELFVLDARSYRSRNDLADTPENAKTLLGAQQVAWLTAGLRASTATWKVVASGVALSIAAGPDESRDGWANGHGSESPTYTGFERELRGLLADFDAANLRNVVVLSGDVHQPRQVRYDADYDGDGDSLLFHELIAGPLSASTRGPSPLDLTFSPVNLYAEGDLFNFGVVDVRTATDGKAHLRAEVRDATGAVRPGSLLDLTPR